MPLSQDTLATIEEALGTGPASGQSAPNGHNFQGALNVINRTAQDMDEYGLTVSDLPDAKAQEYREAVEDLKFWCDQLDTVFGTDMPGSMDGIELPGGAVVDFP